jgi:hypothetical protein
VLKLHACEWLFLDSYVRWRVALVLLGLLVDAANYAKRVAQTAQLRCDEKNWCVGILKG